MFHQAICLLKRTRISFKAFLLCFLLPLSGCATSENTSLTNDHSKQAGAQDNTGYTCEEITKQAWDLSEQARKLIEEKIDKINPSLDIRMVPLDDAVQERVDKLDQHWLHSLDEGIPYYHYNHDWSGLNSVCDNVYHGQSAIHQIKLFSGHENFPVYYYCITRRENVVFVKSIKYTPTYAIDNIFTLYNISDANENECGNSETILPTPARQSSISDQD